MNYINNYALVYIMHVYNVYIYIRDIYAIYTRYTHMYIYIYSAEAIYIYTRTDVYIYIYTHTHIAYKCTKNITYPEVPYPESRGLCFLFDKLPPGEQSDEATVSE